MSEAGRPRTEGRRWSLAARLTAYFALTAFVLLAGAAYLQYRTLVASLAAEDDQLLREWLAVAGDVRAGLARTPRGREPRGPLVRTLSAQCEPTGGPITTTATEPPPQCDRSAGELPRFRTWHAPDGDEWRVVSVQTETGWIEALLDRESDAAVLRAYRRELVLVLGGALLAAAGLGFAVARRGLRPLARLAGRVATIEARSLGQRLAVGDEPAEIRTLVSSFDDMLARLDRAFRALTEFSAELAHEFRTPIHVLRQQAEVALQRARTPEEYRELLASSLEELERMRRMVDDILFLARAEDPRAVIQRTGLSVADEIGDVADFLQADAAERGIALVCDVPAGLELVGDRMLVRRALVNVVSNALRHTPTGGRIELRARAAGGVEDGTLLIEVCDTGCGVAAELLPHVFDRHVRGADAGTRHPGGAGLGLAVVRGIMELHGGTVALSSRPGEGARVTLSFPGDSRRSASAAWPASDTPRTPRTAT